MSNSAKLKKKAAELESKKQYEKALELYEQVLNSTRTSDEERDVPLYNRVGDIHYRIGNNEQAINYYEQAADLYAEGGFFNNAIALCNKILRYSPGRTIIYYKLGIISAKKGFNSDAKQNFLEYADRMQCVGKMDEAFRALKEFADLCPGQDDVRLMLAEQLARADRRPEALEQLEVLYDILESEGRTGEAAATIERMKTLDPTFKPRRSATPRAPKKEGLVFLDLDFATPPAPVPAGSYASDDDPGRLGKPQHASIDATEEKPSNDEPSATISRALEGLELTSLGAGGDVAPDVDRITNEQMSADDESRGAEATSSGLHFIKPADEAVDDPRVIPFPVGRTPAGSMPAVHTPTGNGALSGHDLISDEDQSASLLSDASPIAPDDDFVDLGEWLERNRTPASTRMVAHDEEAENNEQRDFAEMLDKFKAGISRNVDEEDFDSHYDLGIAFAEMGLMDEAIGSFQKALRGPDQRVRASEAIGQCFMDKGEAAITMAVLAKLLHEPGMSDSRLVGVLYLLGRAAESLGRSADAAGYFQRVLAVQIGFRDAADRLSALTAVTK
ncbi:MAG: tetratricopeptide repeat protein [Gemmatimonadaceae bacterium]